MARFCMTMGTEQINCYDYGLRILQIDQPIHLSR